MSISKWLGDLIGGALVADSFVSLNHQLKQGAFPVKRAHKAVQAIESKPKSKTAIGVLKKIFMNYQTPKRISKDLKDKIDNLKQKALKTCNEMTEARTDEDFRRMVSLIQKIKDIIGPTS